jgi:hypothetical protein
MVVFSLITPCIIPLRRNPLLILLLSSTSQIIVPNHSSQRYKAKIDPFEEKLRARVIYFAKLFGRYGFRKVTRLLNEDSFDVGHD